jgi:hypothetical protein
MKTEDVVERIEARRRDVRGKWHRVESAPCEECGCPYDYSVDDPGVFWEAGSNLSEDCLDSMCDCHVMPVLGLPVSLHFASAS